MIFSILAGLFWIAFISATLLPAQSELALAGALLYPPIPPWLSVLAAWSGNTLGSCLNWLLGKSAARLASGKSFGISKKALARAENFYKKYGRWSLLLSWAPVIGDPLTLAAGLLGEKFSIFLIVVAAAKLLRYLAICIVIL